MNYTVERSNEHVLTVRHTDIAAGWEQRYLLISDVHFDSPHCDRRLLTKHLDQAKRKGAGVLCIGDWFDAMGGKQDKRAVKSTVRPENTKDNYFDTLVDDSVQYLYPYADNLVIFGNGNHETSVLKHNETDLLERMTRELGCQHGGYSFFVWFVFDSGKTTSKVYYANHGNGGGGPVSMGSAGNARRASYLVADIYHTGHIHVAKTEERTRISLNGKGTMLKSVETHVITPGYKDEYDMAGGYAVEKGFMPNPVGGYWLTWYYDHDAPGRINYRLERAN